MDLPGSEEYNVASVVITFFAGGSKVKEVPLSGGVIKGPGSYPISASATLPASATSGRIRVEAKVVHGSREEDLVSEAPVVLPTPDMRVKPPRIFVGVSSVTPLDGNLNATLSVSLYNPNTSKITMQEAKIVLGGQERALSFTSIDGGASASASASFVLPNKSQTLDVRVEGKFKVNGTEYSFSYTGSVGVPSVPLTKPYATVSASTLSASSSGIAFTLSGKLFNPNKTPLKVDRVYVKVLGGGNLVQEFNWVEGNTVPPEGNLALPDKSITVDEDMYRAKVEVHMVHGGTDDVVASFPLLAVDLSEVLEPPNVKAALSYDANTYRCTVTVAVENPNEKTLDVNNLRIYVNQSGNDDENTFSAFSVPADGSESRSFTPNMVVSTTADITVEVSGDYGFSTLHAWVPFKYTFVGRCG